MLKKRVIFTLLYDRGTFMLSRNFRLQKVGNIQWLKKNYNFSKVAFSIDELVILDVSRSEADKNQFYENIQSLTEECFIPIAAGGGVKSIEDAQHLLRSGADKVVINSILASNKDIVKDMASVFGKQCLVASVDVKRGNNDTSVWIDNGAINTNISLSEYLSGMSELPIGELYLNSIDRDGTGQGYDFTLLDEITKIPNFPLIMAGGAGKNDHLIEGLNDTRIDAVATAHLFNFVGDGLVRARSTMHECGINVASWNQSDAEKMKNCIIQPEMKRTIVNE